MAKVIGKAPPPRGKKGKEKRRNKLREQAFRDICKEYPQLADTEEKRAKLFEMIKDINIAVDGSGKMRMFYKGEEK